MHYRDLEAIEARSGPAKAIGWLAGGYDFPRGQPSTELVFSLIWGARSLRANQTRGYHVCEFCDVEEPRIEVSGRPLILGSADLLVHSVDGQAYLAPNLVVHYVQDHAYLPPAEFQEALISSWQREGKLMPGDPVPGW